MLSLLEERSKNGSEQPMSLVFSDERISTEFFITSELAKKLTVKEIKLLLAIKFISDIIKFDFYTENKLVVLILQNQRTLDILNNISFKTDKEETIDINKFFQIELNQH